MIQVPGCTQGQIQAAVSAAPHGETLLIPAGQATYTLPVKIGTALAPKNLTLVFDGTVIVNDVPAGGGPDEQSVFVLYTANDLHTQPRIKGVTIRAGAIGGDSSGGAVRIRGQAKNWRVHGCRFEDLKTPAIRTADWTLGLIDHSFFIGSNELSIEVGHQAWGGGQFGNGSFAAPLDLGGPSAVYVEDCEFTDLGPVTAGHGVIDCDNGGRAVVRHCTLRNMNFQTHGTEKGPSRGCVKIEIYDNVLHSDATQPSRVLHTRGGTGVFFNNRATGSYHMRDTLACYRTDCDWGPPFFKATGLAAYDKNDGTVYAEGTHGGTDNNAVLVVPGTSWAVRQWVGYSAHNLRTGLSAIILDSGLETIHVAVDHETRLPGILWNNGDTFRILRCYPALDQIGWTGGLFLNGNPPQPVGWPEQVLAPFYAWDNTINGATAKVTAQSPNIVEGRDFFNAPMPGYTPYVYPHPLNTDSVTPPPPPPPPELPFLAAIQPDSGKRGTSVHVILTGSGFTPDATVKISGRRVTLRNVTVAANAIGFDVEMLPSASASRRNVTVSTFAGTSNALGFTITK